MTDPRKEIFDAMRAAAPAGLFTNPGNILALDNLLDAFGVPRAASPGKRRVGPKGIALIQGFEKCERALPGGRFAAYPDPDSKDGLPWTIGWGSTGTGIRQDTLWTTQQCDDRFANDLVAYADEVSAAIGTAATTQEQFDALVSFHYNTGAIAKATLTKKHVAGDYAGAKREFATWNHNDGKVSNGLTRRRAAEAALYGGKS